MELVSGCESETIHCAHHNKTNQKIHYKLRDREVGGDKLIQFIEGTRIRVVRVIILLLQQRMLIIIHQYLVISYDVLDLVFRHYLMALTPCGENARGVHLDILENTEVCNY